MRLIPIVFLLLALAIPARAQEFPYLIESPDCAQTLPDYELLGIGPGSYQADDADSLQVVQGDQVFNPGTVYTSTNQTDLIYAVKLDPSYDVAAAALLADGESTYLAILEQGDWLWARFFAVDAEANIINGNGSTITTVPAGAVSTVSFVAMYAGWYGISANGRTGHVYPVCVQKPAQAPAPVSPLPDPNVNGLDQPFSRVYLPYMVTP